MTEPEIGAFQNIGPPTFAGYVRLPHSVDIPETSHLLTEVGAFQNIGSPTITPPQPDFPSRLQYVLTYFSEDDLEDLPPSYSSLDVLQAGPEYFKT